MTLTSKSLCLAVVAHAVVGCASEPIQPTETGLVNPAPAKPAPADPAPADAAPADTAPADTAPADPVPANPGVVLSMARTRCFGWCPAYSVAVFGDGRLTYQGDYYVKKIGKEEGQVDRMTIDSLRMEGAAAGLTALASDCCNCQDVTDSPSVSLSYDFGAGKSGAIQHYLGCSKAPGWLAKFENRIDELLGTEQFIGTPAERASLFGPPH